MLQGDFNFDNAGQMDGGEGADDNDEDKGGYLTVDPNEQSTYAVPDRSTRPDSPDE